MRTCCSVLSIERSLVIAGTRERERFEIRWVTAAPTRRATRRAPASPDMRKTPRAWLAFACG